MTDRRRYGVIEVRRVNAETYWLEIAGQLWSEVEWSPKRRRWCIQDAAGQCLTHAESIVGQNPDPQEAIRIAKRMIVSGEMPTPEEARRRRETNEVLHSTSIGRTTRIPFHMEQKDKVPTR
jgi:hypothetical protein